MSTIPLIFKEVIPTYSIIQGKKSFRSPASNLSLIILNRFSMFKDENYMNHLGELPLKEIIILGSDRIIYEPAFRVNLSQKIKIIDFKEIANMGVRINTAMREAKGEFVMILWDNVELDSQCWSAPFLNKMMDKNIFCQVPHLFDKDNQLLATMNVPVINRNKLQLLTLQPENDKNRTLFAFDYIGFYNREKFLKLGGFDPEITNSYWQQVDLGFRAGLWGEEVLMDYQFSGRYHFDEKLENTTKDKGFILFFYRNIAVKFNMDHGILPWYKVFSFIRRYPDGLFGSFRKFRKLVKWVKRNRFRFEKDSQTLVDLWE